MLLVILIILAIILIYIVLSVIFGGWLRFNAKIDREGFNADLELTGLLSLFKLKLDAEISEHKRVVTLKTPLGKQTLFPKQKKSKNRPAVWKKLIHNLDWLQMREIDVSGRIGAGSAAASALASGTIATCFYSTLPALFNTMDGISIRILPDFDEIVFLLSVKGIFHIDFPHVISIILHNERR